MPRTFIPLITYSHISHSPPVLQSVGETEGYPICLHIITLVRQNKRQMYFHIEETLWGKTNLIL
jgi:hypothetical protein